MFQKILVPVAFSARCKGAVQYAEAVARHFQSQLILLHVVAPVAAYAGVDGMVMPADVMEDLMPAATAQLASFAKEVLDGIPAKQVVVTGDPAQRIVDYANAVKVDLIVMPTHGYGPFRRFLLGSVTAKALHDTSCPVWTGPHMEGAPVYSSIAFRKILCAIDLGPDSLAVLQWAGDFARDCGSSLDVVHAVPGPAPGHRHSEPEGANQVISRAREHISFLQEDLGITGEIAIKTGDAPSVVRAAAEDIGADLLVIGRGHGDGLIGRLRTNAYAILRESACPVAAI